MWNDCSFKYLICCFKCPPLAVGGLTHDKNKIKATIFRLQHANTVIKAV